MGFRVQVCSAVSGVDKIELITIFVNFENKTGVRMFSKEEVQLS